MTDQATIEAIREAYSYGPYPDYTGAKCIATLLDALDEHQDRLEKLGALTADELEARRKRA